MYCGIIPSADAATSTDDPNAVMMEVVNCQNYVNLRASASSQSESLAQLPLGTQVQATGKTEAGFIEVTYEGKTGFVGESYLAKR